MKSEVISHMMFKYNSDSSIAPFAAIISAHAEVTWKEETTQLKRFMVFTVVKTWIEVFRIMTLCSLVGGYQHRSLP
jgi:hypothetical protein